MKINETKLWISVWILAALVAAWAHSFIVVPLIVVAGVAVWKSKSF